MNGTTAFWEFSLGFYALADIPGACMRCQDEAGADVNLLLYTLWRADRGEQTTPEHVAEQDDLVREWRENVVHPLRASRCWLKGKAAKEDTFRNRVAQLELEAERLEQERLASYPRTLPRSTISRGETARRNLAAYSRSLKTPLPDDVMALIIERFEAGAPARLRNVEGSCAPEIS